MMHGQYLSQYDVRAIYADYMPGDKAQTACQYLVWPRTLSSLPPCLAPSFV